MLVDEEEWKSGVHRFYEIQKTGRRDRMNGKMTILACITGFLLDCIFGDPVWMYHPIRVIGNLISVLEKGLRKLLCSWIPASEQKKKNKEKFWQEGFYGF